MAREADIAEFEAALERGVVEFAELAAQGDWGRAETQLGVVFGIAWLVSAYADRA